VYRRYKNGTFRSVLLIALAALGLQAKPDIVLADFEGTTYAPWITTGTAFGTGPARGTLPNQMRVSGYIGHGLANSFVGGDASTGTLTSPSFKISRHWIRFRIGGGKNLQDIAMNLLVDGVTRRSATGPNDRPGGTEALHPENWDVSDLIGKTAQIRIIDNATGGWGHINVDDILMTDRKPPMMLENPSRTLLCDHRYLLFPIQNDAPRRKMTLRMEGGWSTTVAYSVADGNPDWWAAVDVSQHKGKSASVTFDQLSDDSKGLSGIKTSDTLPDLYHESGRGQFHFSAKRGWLNDPNGLCFYRGEYHMFFQHDPWNSQSEYKTWGHAVSKDLIHWNELPEAILPDELGSMWSGSAVVDHSNTAGFGSDALVLIYTAAGNPSTQCIAYSLDGRHFTKYAGNPVLPQMTAYNRDPKVMWYAATHSWVMTVFVEHGEDRTIEFYSSPDLKHWTYMSRTSGFFECPDFFELPVQGTDEHRWVLSAANTNYQVGSFDGHAFHPETPILQGIYGEGYYAPQTFFGALNGRRIQIGWFLTNPPAMPFTQSMSIPMEFNLRHVGGSYELVRSPIHELDSLEHDVVQFTSAASLAGLHADAARIKLTVSQGSGVLNMRGAKIAFQAGPQGFVEVAGHKVPVSSNELSLDAFIDRAGLEVFVDGKYMPSPFIPDPHNHSYGLTGELSCSGIFAKMTSIW